MQRLPAYGRTVHVLEEEVVRKDERHFLRDLDIPAGKLSVRTYSNAATAEDAYGALEGEAEDHRDVVLVAVSSMAALPRAYPNYFLDTSASVDLVADVVKTSGR